jgi:hypothetical protein
MAAATASSPAARIGFPVDATIKRIAPLAGIATTPTDLPIFRPYAKTETRLTGITKLLQRNGRNGHQAQSKDIFQR